MSNPLERSRLFAIQPVTGSPGLQESLVSYLVRLASAHQMSPRQLIKREFLPWLPLKSGPAFSSFFAEDARTINGMAKYAEAFIDATSKLTMLAPRPFEQLTLRAWRAVVPENGTGLLATDVQWCPACLREQHAQRKECYFPLAWSMAHYQVCRRHHQPLRRHCPWCGKTQHFIPDFPDQSRCTHCLGFLGAEHGAQQSTAVTDRQLWWANSIESMLQANPEAGAWATHRRLCHQLMAMADRWADGEKKSLARLLGLTDTSIACWVTKRQRPTFPQLLQVCDAVGLMVDQLFTREIASVLRLLPPGRYLEIGARATPTEHPSKVCSRFQAIVADEHDTRTVAVVAKELAVTRSYLNYWCRDLTLAQARKAKQQARQIARQRSRLAAKILRNTVIELTAIRVYPSTRKVNNRLREQGLTLKRPELRQMYNDLRKATQSDS